MIDRQRIYLRSRVYIIFTFVIVAVCCHKLKPQDIWLDEVFEQGRSVFFQAIENNLTHHPLRSQLTEAEIAKIGEVESKYGDVYGILINVFYQKDEPVFSELLAQNKKQSRSRFEEKYMELVDFAASMFVQCFFMTDDASDFIRMNFPGYKDLDAVDLVLRSIGYFARLDEPETRTPVRPLSPEFEKQGALDAAKFREAHKISKGKAVKIAILDTGIDTSHPVFEATKWGQHFSLVGRKGKPWATDASLVDWGYHGTLITSIATVYAPEAQISVYKFGDGDTQNDPAYQLLTQGFVAAAIYRAVHDGNDVISISASGGSLDSDYLREACAYAFKKNRVVISGALYSRWFDLGNTRNYPSQYDTVLSVTAAEKKADGAYGYWDVCAAQETNDVAVPNDIFGAFPTYVDEEDTYIPSISAAIPVVAALFAMAMSVSPRQGDEAPGEYSRMLMDLIKNSANPHAVGFDGFSPECGFGLIDAEAVVKNALILKEKRSQNGINNDKIE